MVNSTNFVQVLSLNVWPEVAIYLNPIQIQGGLWGFQYYQPHPHKTANYQPILIFSTIPVSPVKFFANTIETYNLENFLCTLYRDRF